MSEAISNRTIDPRLAGVDVMRRETISSPLAPNALQEKPERDTVDGRDSAAGGPSPLEAQLTRFLNADRSLDDMLGAPQFPLALREAAALLQDLAAAAPPATHEDGASNDDAAMAALLGDGGPTPPPTGDAEDARLFSEAADALQIHLDARTTFRAGAARLMKT